MDRDKERAIEWDCEQVLRRYYNHVHHRELDEAVALFTPDADWHALGVDLKGRARRFLRVFETDLPAELCAIRSLARW